MPSSENLSMAKINEEETKPSVEKVVVVEKPKLTFEEELALASVEAGLKLSKKCTACHSLKSGGPNGVGPTLWNIVMHQRQVLMVILIPTAYHPLEVAGLYRT